MRVLGFLLTQLEQSANGRSLKAADLLAALKAVIIEDRRASAGELLKNAEFSRHWDFVIRACRPYRAQTKGNEEGPVRYIRDGFSMGGSSCRMGT